MVSCRDPCHARPGQRQRTHSDGGCGDGRSTLPALIDWLASLHSEFRLRPRQLELQAADGTGRARFEARFEAAGS